MGKSKRMGPGKIRSFLRSMYPNRIDIPFDPEITGVITSLVHNHKNNVETNPSSN